MVADPARLDAARILVNQVSAEGAIGGPFNALRPSLTLVCGAGAGNFNTHDITVERLLDIHRVGRFRENRSWTRIPRATWLDSETGPDEIRERYTGGRDRS